MMRQSSLFFSGGEASSRANWAFSASVNKPFFCLSLKAFLLDSSSARERLDHAVPKMERGTNDCGMMARGLSTTGVESIRAGEGGVGECDGDTGDNCDG